jgi:hypothetical protein
MALGKFTKPPVGGKPSGRKSKYSGITAAQPRDPMPGVGLYRFRVLSCEEGHNPGKGTDSFKCRLQIVDLEEHNTQHKVGQTVFYLQLVSGPAGPSGLARVKTFVMAAAGFGSESAYDEFDPDGGFIDAITGVANGYSDAAETFIGRLVDCSVSRGNTTPDGTDFYREYAWAVVPEAEQAS